MRRWSASWRRWARISSGSDYGTRAVSARPTCCYPETAYLIPFDGPRIMEQLASIRRLLDEIEAELKPEATKSEFQQLGGLEIPEIIADVVDLLFPELKPYEAAMYMYMLRHSIIAAGTPYLRVSRRGLRTTVVKSPYAEQSKSGDGGASYNTVRITLEGLAAIPAIRQEGEPTREGTLYRILLPEEIPACEERRASRSAAERQAPSEADADYYNVRENRLQIFERDSYRCSYCSKQLTRFTATLDHIRPVAEGGDNSRENLTTACLQCNSRKTRTLLSDFLAKSG